MTDKTNHQVKPGELDPTKKVDMKTFDFAKEDQDFLQVRQALINQKKIEVADIDFSMQQYIIGKVLPRLAIDPAKNMIQFNVAENKLTVIPKPPEILVPPKDIIIPGKS